MLTIFLTTLCTLTVATTDLETTTTASSENIAVVENTQENKTENTAACTTEHKEAVSSITVTNAITEDMLKYKHWTGTYSPDKFTVSINGTTVQPGESCTITDRKSFDVAYEYSFVNGYRTGKETLSYVMNENSSNGTLTFSWNSKPHHVSIDNAQPQTVTKT